MKPAGDQGLVDQDSRGGDKSDGDPWGGAKQTDPMEAAMPVTMMVTGEASSLIVS